MLKYTYYTDPFLTEFQTEVEAVKSVAGQYHVVLKDTISTPPAAASLTIRAGLMAHGSSTYSKRLDKQCMW